MVEGVCFHSRVRFDKATARAKAEKVCGSLILEDFECHTQQSELSVKIRSQISERTIGRSGQQLYVRRNGREQVKSRETKGEASCVCLRRRR